MSSFAGEVAIAHSGGGKFWSEIPNAENIEDKGKAMGGCCSGTVEVGSEGDVPEYPLQQDDQRRNQWVVQLPNRDLLSMEIPIVISSGVWSRGSLVESVLGRHLLQY